MNDLFDKSAKSAQNPAAQERRDSERRAQIRAAQDRRIIAIRGAREHNLKNIDLDIPRDELVVFTGLSGSGKSSLAFDTIYAEGQRRYVESLSAYARQFLEMMQKPDVDQIDGLSPAISIEQKTTSRNPRSTVGTVTEIYDYMRLFWARVGVPYSPATGLPIESQTVSQMVDRILALPEGTRLYLLAPVVRGRKGEYRKELAEFMKKGYQRVKIDGAFYEIADAPALDKKFTHDIDVVVDRIVVRPDIAARLAEFARAGAETRRRLGGRGACRDHAGRRRRDHQQGQPAAQPDRRRTPHFFGKIRLPRLRLHHSRDRAAAVLVQQPVRRLPEMRRPWRRAAHRCRSRHPRQGAHAAQRRHRAVGQILVALLHADARRAGQALQVHARHQVEGPAEENAGRHPLWQRRHRAPLLLRRRHARLRHQARLRRRHHQSRAPLQGDRQRLGARGDRALFHRRAVRRLQRLSAQARSAVREDRRQAHRRSVGNVGQRRSRLVH